MGRNGAHLEAIGGRLEPVTTINEEWLKRPSVVAVMDAIASAGYRALFVGGCVRNALLSVPASDIDLATDAVPEVVTKACKAAGLKVIPTGIEHGTLTVIAFGEPIEVTTFRRDVETDGRRAVVAYSNKLEDDAMRRDFTINALYADKTGKVIDPVGGLADIGQRRIRFIEDAEARIREDYLRILRFFRFHAWYGSDANGFEKEALAAIAANLDGLGKLSPERVGVEMLKLLAAPDPAFTVSAMAQIGLLTAVLPGTDAKWLNVLTHLEAKFGIEPDPMRRLAVLGPNDPFDRLRISKKQRTLWRAIRDLSATGENAATLGYRCGVDVALSGVLVRAALRETDLDSAFCDDIRRGADAQFPIKAADLADRFSGPALGKQLKHLEETWIASNFERTREDLLAL